MLQGSNKGLVCDLAMLGRVLMRAYLLYSSVHMRHSSFRLVAGKKTETASKTIVLLSLQQK